jgi:glutaredoxin
MNKATLATSEFCGPCKLLKETLEQKGISVEYKDLSRDTDFFIAHGIRSVPTLVTVEGECIAGADSIVKYLTTYEKCTGG